ncbi:FAD-binding oxidoreductase [Paenibacillus sp. N1-5-1-14]|uniref:NAD(P)/FAD-dependent oxidoreductase n=1 Tax=Paenibacillus radicibacter TaxID=2972488 RepID=UPI002158C8B9|nr:FAD-dependent oxidoreductase [Paenibacillus radicibacter]MCR8645380.1 FAD-binding oxidoreductase [Paenibacillus radicibacter]
MDLRSSVPGWPELTTNKSAYPMLQQHTDCDVLIVGAGMSGALISYELASKGFNTVTIEKRTVGAGSTCANTGLLQFCNDKSLTSCIHSFGVEKAVRFYTLCKEAVSKLIAIHESLPFSADLIPRSSLYVASCDEDVQALRTEYEALMKYGFHVEWRDTSKIQSTYGFRKPAAIITHGDAEVNPFAFVHALFETATSKYGLQLYEHTKVSHREEHKDHITIITDKGIQINAKHIVYAMGYEIQEMKKDSNAVIQSTFAIMTEPLSTSLLDQVWQDRNLIWETARPYKYFRTTKDNRIIAGGFDIGLNIEAQRERMLSHTATRLVDEIKQLFPSLGEINAKYSWTGAFGSTHDGLPMIGMHPKFPRSTFIEGYGGNGTVYSSIATDLIPALIETGYHPDAHLFEFDRPRYPTST